MAGFRDIVAAATRTRTDAPAGCPANRPRVALLLPMGCRAPASRCPECYRGSHPPLNPRHGPSVCAARVSCVSTGDQARVAATPEGSAARAEALQAYHRAQVVDCTRCALAGERTQVVVGDGDPDAGLMFVGEAPGYHEDRQGRPFVGAAGQLLDRLLGEIGLDRSRVFVANVLKCRPPGNRDPQPDEIASCEPHLMRQISLVRPHVIATLGNFATKLLSGRPDGISRVHGCELPIRLGEVDLLLYPLFHPAAVLRNRGLEETMRADFARLPGLLGTTTVGAPGATPPSAGARDDVAPVPPPQAPAESGQLGLF